MKNYTIKLIFIISLLCFLFSGVSNAETLWHPLSTGIEYTKISRPLSFPASAIYAFRINLRYYQLELGFTNNRIIPLITARDLVRKKRALIGINGGFFSTNLKPLGLRISNRKQYTPIKRISWWGVFFIKSRKARIVTQKIFRLNQKYDFAIQSGPRLVINGRIPSLKPGFANRSALGITKNGRVIIAITKNMPMTTTDFAKIMQKPTNKNGLGCINAINLDGGKSSQLYARVNNFTLNIPNLATIADVVLVVPRG